VNKKKTPHHWGGGFATRRLKKSSSVGTRKEGDEKKKSRRGYNSYGGLMKNEEGDLWVKKKKVSGYLAGKSGEWGKGVPAPKNSK